MADLTLTAVQQPGLTGVAPLYVAASAADFFTAAPNSRYEIHYKNGATTTGGALPFKVTDPTTPIPVGSSAVAGFADGIVAVTGMLATTELKAVIANSTRFMDSQNRINLVHGGTLTTVTVNILGPFPA